LREIAFAKQSSGEETGKELSEECDYHDGGAKGKLLRARLRIVERIFD